MAEKRIGVFSSRKLLSLTLNNRNLEEIMQKIRKCFNEFNDAMKGPSKIEYVVAVIILMIAAFMFCFTKDFKLTVTQSLDFNDCLFHGKVFRYYSEINQLALSGHYSNAWPQTLLAGANYSIINYASVGLICLPVYIFDRLFDLSVSFLVYEMIVKAAFAAMMVYMTIIVYDICKLLKPVEKDAKWVSLCFLTSPVFLFASIIISHLDIFSILFLLLGIKYMIKGNHWLELLFFMLAAFYKPFILLGILPILILREKRILYLLRDAVAVLSGILLQNVVYHFDPGYAETQKFMSETYGFIGRFFGVGFAYKRNCYDSTVSYFVVTFVIICVIAYMIREVKWAYVFAIPFMVMGAFVLFVQWHPNWMVLVVPFLTLMLLYTHNIRLTCILECVFSLFVILMTALGWLHNYDIRMINGGVISKLLHLEINKSLQIHKVLTRKFPDIPIDIYASLLCAAVIGMMLVFAVDTMKYRSGKTDAEKVRKWERCAVWCRVLPAAGFMAYALLTCFI